MLLPATTLCVAGFVLPVQAQNFRFTLRAEPDVIPANGTSTTSIFVQVPQRGAITPSGVVRFATTAGVIESQAQLSGGVARVLLRSANTPGTAVITAFVGNSREVITVEFSEDNGMTERFLEVSSPYTAFGKEQGILTSSGKSVLSFGELTIESDVRLDVDLQTERVWAQGNAGTVSIRHGRGDKAKILRGDRLFYDLRRKRGVIRRSGGDLTNTESGARQEFVGTQFTAPPQREPKEAPPETQTPAPNRLAPEGSPIENAPEVVAVDEKPAILDAELDNFENAAPETEADERAALTERSPADYQNEKTVADGALADTPAEPTGDKFLMAPLATKPRPDSGAGFRELPPIEQGEVRFAYEPQIVELPVPNADQKSGYWVTARRVRVFPRDEVQFERATIYFNGGKAFGAPVYVLPLDGSFNPTTDMFSFNSEGGLAVKFPFYYQASKHGTGSITFRNDPKGGFSTLGEGPSLELNQQYWLSPRSQGKIAVDSIGRGAWNLNAQHELQLNSTTTANLYLNMPRHRDLFTRASLLKEFSGMQMGLEAFYDKPENARDNLRGQFFARMRPKNLGKSGWSYNLSFNALAAKNVAFQRVVQDGGGVGVPGSGGTRIETRYRSLLGQTVSASLQSPQISLWKGAQLNANLFSTAFNYSDGRRGVSPGANLSFAQQLGRSANLRLDYTYDRASLGLYGANSNSFTHYISGSLGAQLRKDLAFSTFLSKSLSDDSLYGSADLSYAFAKRWRAGVFADYSNFSSEDSLNYGLSVGRQIAGREVSLNWDAVRGKFYLELGNRQY